MNICKLLLKLLHLCSIKHNKPHHLCSKASHPINNDAFTSTSVQNVSDLLESFEECLPVAIPFEGQASAFPIHDEPGPFKHSYIYNQDRYSRAWVSHLLKKPTKIRNFLEFHHQNFAIAEVTWIKTQAKQTATCKVKDFRNLTYQSYIEYIFYVSLEGRLQIFPQYSRELVNYWY